jgi:hypothetical protein
MNRHFTRRDVLCGIGGAMTAVGPSTGPSPVDYALARQRDSWLHHPVIGDPSWDAFIREPGNPILTGSEPYAWPVNGFLFRDPPSGRWFCYVSVYPRGYFGKPNANSRILREREGGGWEDLGLLFGDPRPSFVGTSESFGAMTDVCVVYDAGRYHLVYGWCDPTNSRGGIAYASAENPEGPFMCAPAPLHDDGVRKPILGVYVRAYASTLLKRRDDWLILHMMSTPGNAGGTWALFAMTAPSVTGPYCDPVPLLLPQSDAYHPPLAEFFPAFAHRGRVYAPATSVALNRTFQSLFSAPVERAHHPEAWRLDRLGSVWHAEPAPSEAQGIWGQTFSGQVAPDGTLRAMFPSKTAGDFGTIGLARRPWARAYRNGFVVSACRGPAAAVLRRAYGEFELRAEIAATGPYAVCFGCHGPFGPDRNGADSTLHPRMRTARIEWRRTHDGWSLVALDEAGHARTLASGDMAPVSGRETVEIARRGGTLSVSEAGREVYTGIAPNDHGRIELLVESGIAHVSRFAVTGAALPPTDTWLATEALAGAAAMPGEWEAEGMGFVSAKPGARAKWNYTGAGFRLHAPRGPRYGRCTVIIDGREHAEINIHTADNRASAVVLERALPRGYHAVALVAHEGRVPLDMLEVDA